MHWCDNENAYVNRCTQCAKSTCFFSAKSSTSSELRLAMMGS